MGINQQRTKTYTNPSDSQSAMLSFFVVRENFATFGLQFVVRSIILGLGLAFRLFTLNRIWGKAMPFLFSWLFGWLYRPCGLGIVIFFGVVGLSYGTVT